MTCEPTRDWLLHADRSETPPADVAGHLTACADCRALAARLDRLEACYRALPLPASADAAKAAFLERTTVQPADTPSPVRRRWAAPRWVLAATVLVAVGLGAWALLTPGEARASGGLVEQLIDWNLEIAEAGADPAEAASRAAAFQADLQKQSLPAEERALAETLIENGTWLAAHDEPLEKAERFTAVADRLVDRLGRAATAGERRKSDRLARQYRRVSERVDATVAKAEKAGAKADAAWQRRLEKLLADDADRADKLAELLERAPDATKKEIRKALEPIKKSPKHSKKGKGA
jgi:hypothetical protein